MAGLVPSDSALRTKLAMQSRVTIFELQFCPNLCKTWWWTNHCASDKDNQYQE